MSENPPVPNPPASTPPDGTPVTTGTIPTKRKRRWWLRILIALPILLIILVLLAPTIASLGLVRAMILPTISSSVAPNGKLDITNWSFGWSSGQRIEGVTLLDDKQAAVAHLNIKTDASLWALLRGNYNLGDTVVDVDFDVRVDPTTGRVNALHILGADPKRTTATTESAEKSTAGDTDKKKGEDKGKEDIQLPINLDALKGVVTINVVGTVSSTDPNDKSIPFTKLDKSTIKIDLNDVHDGAKLDGELALNVGGKPASITLNGTVAAFEKNAVIVDPNRIGANVVAGIQSLDLSVMNAALAAAGLTDTDVGGTLKGKLVLDVKPGGAGSIQTQDGFGISDFHANAPQLQGDTFTSKRIDVPLNISRAAGSDDIKIESAGITSDLGSVAISGSVPQTALMNLRMNDPPGATGSINIKTTVPSFAAVAKMFPHLAKPQQGVEITGGKLADDLTVNIVPDGVTVSQQLKLNAAGTQNGKPISLDEISFNTSADVALAKDLVITPNSVRKLTLSLTSAFAKVEGGGVPSKIQLTGNVDLTKLYDQVGPFTDKLTPYDLRGTANFTLNTNGSPTDLTTPLGVASNFDLKGVTFVNNGESLLTNENITGNVDALYKQTSDQQVVTFKKLAVNSDSGLFDVAMIGDSAWVAMKTGGGMGGVAQFKIDAALDRVAAPFLKTVDPSMKLKRGRLDSTVTLAIDDATKGYKLGSDVTVTKIAVGDVIADETLKLTANATVPEDFGAANATFDVNSSFVTVKGDANVKLSDEAKPKLLPFEMAKSANFTGTVPNLQKLYALVNSLGMIAPETKLGPDGKVLPPMKVAGGSLAFDGKVTRDETKQMTSVVLNVPGLRDLLITRGTNAFKQADPITLAFAADVTTDTSKETIAQQLKHVLISKLNATVPGIAQLTMSDPIDVTFDAAGKPAAKGKIGGTASLGGAGPLLAVVSGANPIPYTGDVAFDQTIAGDSTNITLTGKATASKLAPVDPKAAALPAKMQTIEIVNDIAADSSATTLTIKQLDIAAPNARDVFGAHIVGNVKQLMTQNTLDGVSATISYDLPQLWPLVQPIVDPTGTSIGKVSDIAGKYQKTFTVSGSYPMVDASGKAILFNQSIKSVVLAGDLAIDRFNAAEKGIDLSKLTLPLSVKNGIATIAYADGKTGGGKFTCNEGTGDLSGLSVDLSGDEPILGNLKNHKLVVGVKINPVVANSLGKYVNPIFPNATTASGVLDLTLSTNNLHLGKSLETANSGSASILLSINDLVIGNPLSEDLVGGLVNKIAGQFGKNVVDTEGQNDFVGYIKDGKINFDKGVATQDITLMVGMGSGDATADASTVGTGGSSKSTKSNGNGAVADADKVQPKSPTLYPFSFTGDTRLSDLQINLAAGFPIALIQQKVHDKNLSELLAQLPPQAKLGLTGSATKAKYSFKGDFVNDLIAAAAKQQLGKLLGGKSDGKDSKDGKKNDLGAVLDQIGDAINGNAPTNGSKTTTPPPSDTPPPSNGSKAGNNNDNPPPPDQPSDSGKKKKKKNNN